MSTPQELIEPTTTLGWLTPASYTEPRVQQAFELAGWPLPDPLMSGICVAEQGGEVVGFSVIQTCVHVADPTWVREDLRGTGLFQQLVEAVQDPLRGSGATAYVFVPDARVAAMAVQQGYRPTGWMVYQKTYPAQQEVE